MRKLSNLAMVCWGAVALLAFSGASFAEEGAVTANVTNGKKIYENGKSDAGVPACATCHGDKAMGNDAMGSPRLANVGYAYIVKQLTDYADGKRNDLTMQQMNGIAKSLSVQDRRDLAAYENSFPREGELSDLKALKAEGKPIGDTSLGQALVRYGDKGRVSACMSCHGFNGRGAAPVYPKLSQQKYVYLVNQLTHWRDSTRANDPIEQMQKIAKNLSDADINNAAAFLSQAPDSTPGNGMEVDNQSDMKNIRVTR
jgi:cytochrome c553